MLHRHHQTHKWLDILILNNLVRKISCFFFLNWQLEFKICIYELMRWTGEKKSLFFQSLASRDCFCTCSHDWLILHGSILHFRWQICMDHSRLCHKCRSVTFFVFLYPGSARNNSLRAYGIIDHNYWAMTVCIPFCPCRSSRKVDFVTVLHMRV